MPYAAESVSATAECVSGGGGAGCRRDARAVHQHRGGGVAGRAYAEHARLVTVDVVLHEQPARDFLDKLGARDTGVSSGLAGREGEWEVGREEEEEEEGKEEGI